MRFIDTHCHVDLYENPLAELDDADSAQVGIIAVTNAPFVYPACRNLVAGRANVWVAVGLHPELVGEYSHQVDEFTVHLAETRFVGEVGLDYRVADPATHATQREVLGKIVEACEARPDVVMTLHSRGAEPDLVSMICEMSHSTAILHWYSGSMTHLERAQSHGSYFSVNSAMLRSKNGRRLVSTMDRSRVLSETDGPYAKVRGRRARPCDVPLVVEQLAGLWEDDQEAAQATVLRNWERVLEVGESS